MFVVLTIIYSIAYLIKRYENILQVGVVLNKHQTLRFILRLKTLLLQD